VPRGGGYLPAIPTALLFTWQAWQRRKTQGPAQFFEIEILTTDQTSVADVSWARVKATSAGR